MWSVKCYRFGFDPWGLGLFLLIMLPNLAWFALPAPNDILRAESAAPLLDGLGQCLQIIMVAALCLLVNVCKVAVQLAAQQQGVIQGWTVFFEILLVPLTPHADRLFFFSGYSQTGEIVVANEFIP